MSRALIAEITLDSVFLSAIGRVIDGSLATRVGSSSDLPFGEKKQQQLVEVPARCHSIEVSDLSCRESAERGRVARG